MKYVSNRLIGSIASLVPSFCVWSYNSFMLSTAHRHSFSGVDSGVMLQIAAGTRVILYPSSSCQCDAIICIFNGGRTTIFISDEKASAPEHHRSDPPTPDSILFKQLSYFCTIAIAGVKNQLDAFKTVGGEFLRSCLQWFNSHPVEHSQLHSRPPFTSTVFMPRCDWSSMMDY